MSTRILKILSKPNKVDYRIHKVLVQAMREQFLALCLRGCFAFCLVTDNCHLTSYFNIFIYISGDSGIDTGK